MAILIDADSRVLVQGPVAPVTGPSFGPAPACRPFHAAQVVGCVDLDPAGLAGANVRLLGATPSYPTVAAAVAATGANVSLILAPREQVADAVFAAIEAGIALAVVRSEEVPQADRLRIRARLAGGRTRLIGPGCPGIVSPGAGQLGLPPGFTYAQGCVGILSHSAGLAREVAWQTTLAGLGQSTVVNLARHQIAARAFAGCLSLLVADTASDAIVLIVDPRERIEDELASLLLSGTGGKPVVALVATARESAGARCRESGNLRSFERAAAARQAKVLARAGAVVVETPAQIGQALLAALRIPAPDGPAQLRAGNPRDCARDFASAIRRVEREFYGTVLRVVDRGDEPRISR